MRSLSRQLVIGFALLTAEFVAAQQQSGRIPTVHGTSFAGTQVTLPDDLRDRPVVLVLGFSKSRGCLQGLGTAVGEELSELR